MTDTNENTNLLSTLPRMITSSNITIVYKNKPYIINKAHVNYSKIADLVKNSDATVEQFLNLADLDRSVKNYTQGRVSIINGEVKYDKFLMHNSLTKRMLSMLREGYDISPLVKFMENLMSNPSKTAVDELYGFLEKNSLPITDDGCFLAYKRVRDTYKDWHSDTMENKVGMTVEMPRNQVNDNRNETCSYGLHFCSLEYLSAFHGDEGRIMILKINPQDVVSIPVDYNEQKGRTCRYVVVSEHFEGQDTEAFKSSVYEADGVTIKPAQPTEDAILPGLDMGC